MNKATKIVQGEINRLSNRAAMGLPETYTSPVAEMISAHAPDMYGAEKDELVQILEADDETVPRKVAAGTLVSILGDSRIDVLDPPMQEVPAGPARLGLDTARVDDLFRKYETYGVHRNWIEKECPRFTQEMQAFRIGRFPVTNIEYMHFLSDAPDRAAIPTSWPDGRMPVGRENHPVYTVLPEEADSYAAWLSEKTGRRFRLPTEYEWEYAAAGPEGRDFPWGDTFDAAACNTLETGLLSTNAVGMFPKGVSWVGAHDMAGNVEEYVSTVYHAYPGGDIVRDDLYELLGFYRIARGGAYNRFQDLARCQRRHGPYPKSLYAMGFRLAEEVVT